MSQIRENVRLHDSVLENLDSIKPPRRKSGGRGSKGKMTKNVVVDKRVMAKAKSLCKSNMKIKIISATEVLVINKTD